MCMKPKVKIPAPPPPPPAAPVVLDQEAPEKANSTKSKLAKKKAGTKQYRSTAGAALGGILKKTSSAPINL